MFKITNDDQAEGFGEFFDQSYADDYNEIPEMCADNADWEALYANGIDYRGAARLALTGFEALDDDQVDQALADMFDTMSPEDVENFMRTLGQLGRTAAGIASKAMPVVGQAAGTVLGGIIGGPIGTTIGGHVGGAVGNLAGAGLNQLATQQPRQRRPRPKRIRIRPRRRVMRNIGRRANRVGRAVGQVVSQQATRGVSQLNTLLQNPNVQQAIGSATTNLAGQITNAAGQALSREEANIAIMEAIADIAAEYEQALDVEGVSYDTTEAEEFLASD